MYPISARLDTQFGDRRPALRPGGAAYITPKARRARQKWASTGPFATMAAFKPPVASSRATSSPQDDI
jgi:hypothetical protein